MLKTRLLLAALLLAASASAENVRLKLRIDSVPIDPKKSATKMQPVEPQKAETDTVDLTLGPGYVAATGKDGTTILDFAKRLRFNQRRGEGTTVSSLYAVLGGRQREMVNRQYLAEMMEKAGAGATIPVAASEGELSIRADPPATKIERQEQRGVVRFRWKKVQLGEHTVESVPLSAPERDAFLRYVRYEHGGHPELLGELAGRDGVPRRVTIADEVSARTYAITVLDVTREPEKPYDRPADAARSLADHPQWGPIYKRAAAMTPFTVQSHVAEVEKAADAAFAAGKPLAAFLLYLECNLTNGIMPQGLQTNGRLITSDPSVARVRAAISPKDADSARTALEILAEARETVPEAAHVLHIFEANINTNLGEREKPYEHFHAALSARPMITGVWHDLGDLYLGQYDAMAAWDAWDVARQLAPRFPMMADVEKREAELVAKYPEYF